MGALGSSLVPDVLRSIASTDVTGTYQVIESVLSFPTRILKLTNNSTEDVTVSWDGENDNEYIPAGSFLLLDASANREASQICEVSKGTAIFVKGTAGTGDIYLSSYYVRP